MKIGYENMLKKIDIILCLINQIKKYIQYN